MIEEDYVSYEVAKLLKEKGFNEKTEYVYSDGGELLRLSHLGVKDLTNVDCNDYHTWQFPIEGVTSIISAPTLQRTMKWLREKHNLSVEVYRTACGYIGCVVAIPSGTDIKFLEEDGDDLPSGTYTKWEYACEAAIQYCLKHLI